METSRSKPYLPEEDVNVVCHDPKTNEPRQARFFATHFKTQPPDLQVRHAYVCVEQYGIDPNYIPIWITEDWAKERFRVWCIGKGIELREDRPSEATGRRPTTDTLLAQDQGLIDTLEPHLTLRELSEIRTARRYQANNDQERQYLVGGSFRLLGEYLGRRRTYRRQRERPPFLPLPDLPLELFENNFISGILWESQRARILEHYTQSFAASMSYIEGMRRLATQPVHLSFIQRLEDHFAEVETQEFPMFNRLIAGSLKDIPDEAEIIQSIFPSNHQKEYAYNFTHKTELGPIDLLNGGTATQKTGGSITAMEKAGAKATLVVCPPGIPRSDWAKEIREKYKESVEIDTISGLDELRSYLKTVGDKRSKFTVVGYTLLSSIDTSPDRNELIEALILGTGRDSLIFDESHLSKEMSAQCTRVLFDISRLLPERAPRIGMTATSVVNSVEDLDAPVRILLPYRYPNPGEFTRAARNEPYLVSSLLHGKRLLTTWDKEVVLKDKIPSVERHDVAIPFTPFHQRLYEFVYGDYRDDLPEGRTKRAMLRQASLDPQLVRRYFSPKGIGREISKLDRRLETKQDDRDRQIIESMIAGLRERTTRISGMYDMESAQRDLLEAHEQYQRWAITQNPDEVFDENFLIRLGFDRLALWAFFNLSNSIDTLVAQSSNNLLKQDWEGSHRLFSSKYIRLKQDLDRYAATGDTKVLIFSGFYMTGVTTDGTDGGEIDLLDTDQADREGFRSLYQHLKNWYGEGHVARIDGTVSIEPKRGEDSEREKIRKRFRLDPNLWFLLLTSRSSRLGINLTVPSTKANSHIVRVVHINLDDPDTNADKEQQEGRSVRPGQSIPLEVNSYRATHNEYPTIFRYGFIDQGIAEALNFKRLISQMVLSGIALTPEEERFVRARMVGVHVQELYPHTPREYLIRTFYPKVRGNGYRKNRVFLKALGFEGGTNADFYAANYPVVEEMGIAGHNARVVTEVIRRYKEIKNLDNLRIGSIGSGTGVLQAMLGEPVINIDMMEEMLQVAKSRFNGDGKFVAGDMANLPIRDGIFDVADVSLAMHWTENTPVFRRDNRLISERALSLERIIRATKIGGLISISVPYSHLTNDLFNSWIDTLESDYGVRQIAGLPAGLVRATDFREEPISWIINLERTGEPKLNPESASLVFDFDRLFVDNGPTKGSGRDRVVGIHLSLPHHEFEVISPDGEIDTITFEDKKAQDDLERGLSGEEREFRTGTDVLTKLGLEEYGMYRRLIREARSRWDLKLTEAEKLSLEAVEIWSKEGFEKFNARNIWAELQEILEELQERNN